MTNGDWIATIACNIIQYQENDGKVTKVAEGEENMGRMVDISFVVPCYNSQDYMERCLDSLLIEPERVEVIIVNDGSTDNTGSIADRYAAKYEGTVKVVHKRNGGHGSGVNAGLAAATGTYFKVVDSDDWLDRKALRELLKMLKDWNEKKTGVDLIVCNYLYDHLYEGKVQRMGYENIFKDNVICSWNEIGKFQPSQYLIMHALIFRTEVLRWSGVKLPEHTFYVDNIFANQPLTDVKTICYRNLDLYHYFLGRDDQSVNESVMMKRIDQQIFVTKELLHKVNLKKARELSPKLENYLIRNMSIMLSISDIHLLLIGTKEAYEKRKELWQYYYKKNKGLYRYLRYRTLSGWTNLPGKAGGMLTLTGYRLAKKMYQFN